MAKRPIVYTQGMNFLAAMCVMCVVEEEECFWRFCVLIEDVYGNDDAELDGMQQADRATVFTRTVVKDLVAEIDTLETEEGDVDFFFFGGSAVLNTLLQNIIFSDGNKVMFAVFFVGAYIFWHVGHGVLAILGMCHIMISFPVGIFWCRNLVGMQYFDAMCMFMIFIILHD